jgi:hypothetical protein
MQTMRHNEHRTPVARAFLRITAGTMAARRICKAQRAAPGPVDAAAQQPGLRANYDLHPIDAFRHAFTP